MNILQTELRIKIKSNSMRVLLWLRQKEKEERKIQDKIETSVKMPQQSYRLEKLYCYISFVHFHALKLNQNAKDVLMA